MNDLIYIKGNNYERCNIKRENIENGFKIIYTEIATMTYDYLLELCIDYFTSGDENNHIPYPKMMCDFYEKDYEKFKNWIDYVFYQGWKSDLRKQAREVYQLTDKEYNMIYNELLEEMKREEQRQIEKWEEHKRWTAKEIKDKLKYYNEKDREDILREINKNFKSRG